MPDNGNDVPIATQATDGTQEHAILNIYFALTKLLMKINNTFGDEVSHYTYTEISITQAAKTIFSYD